MNAEKELLLALLIEKYTSTKAQPIKVKVTKKRIRRPNRQPIHRWTESEKLALWDLRHNHGFSWSDIAIQIGKNLTSKQVSSMYANLVREIKLANS